MSKVIINVVTWKEWHNQIFSSIGLKNIYDCLDEIPCEVELCVHTDDAPYLLKEAEKIGLHKKCVLNFKNDFPKSKELFTEQSHLRGQYSSMIGEGFKQARRKAYEDDTVKALNENALLFFYSSHQYHSKGVFKTTFEKLKDKRVVFQSSVRVNFEVFDKLKITHEPRELAKIIHNHYHKFFLDCDIEKYSKRKFATHPYCFVKFLEKGFISHGWQGYIHGLRPFQKVTYLDGQDGKAFNQMFKDFDQDVYVVQDSDEGFSIDLNKKDRFYPYEPIGNSFEEWVFHIINNCGFSNYHRRLAMKSFVCHQDDDIPEENLCSLIFPIIKKSMKCSNLSSTLPKKAIIHAGLWGDYHSDIFAKVGIPNINSLLDEIPIPCEIIVQTETKQIPKFKDLKATFIPFFDEIQTHQHRSLGLTEIIKKAWDEDAVILWWPPDQFYSKGVWETAFKALSLNYRMIMQPSLRLNDDIVPLLQSKALESGLLAQIIRPYFHQLQKCCDWEIFDEKVQACQQPCLYLENEDGFVIKGFQGYIIAVYPTKFKPCDPAHGQDGDLTQQLIDDVEQIYVLKDSDEGLCVDVSPKERFQSHWNIGVTKQQRLKYWASLNINKAHLYMLLQTMVIHYDKVTPKLIELKERLEKETHPIITPIFHSKNLKFKEEQRLYVNGDKRLYVCLVIINDDDARNFCNFRILELAEALVLVRDKDVKIKVYAAANCRGRVRHSLQTYSIKNIEMRDIYLNKPREALIPECQAQVEQEALESNSSALFIFPNKPIEKNMFKELLEKV